MRSLICVTKTTRSTSHRKAAAEPAAASQPETTTHLYVSSLPPQRAERFAALIRGHWGGCESRNHWVRDAQFGEDATRSKNLNLNGNLAVLRCALIAVKARLAPDLSWPALFELASHKPSIALNLLHNKPFK